MVEDNLLPDEGIYYGLGILSAADGWFGHTGQAIGWESLGMYDPETGATMAVMINGTSGSGPFYKLWSDLFDLGLT
jgi:hypothetical protein